MSTIAAGTTSGTALVSTGDTSGQLVLQTNGTTTAVTIGTNQVVTLAQPLPVNSGGMGVASLTANNVILGNGTSAVQFVAPGTNGNVLTSNGTTWTSAAPATGALVYVAGTTASSSATVLVENAFTTYDFYLLTVTDLALSGNNQLRLQLKVNGSYVTGTYYYKNYANATNTYGTSAMIFDTVGVTGSTVGVSLEILIPNPANASTYKSIMCSSFGWGTGNTVVSDRQFFGTTDTTGTLTGLKFFPNSGTISRGTFRLYGIANS